MADGTHIEWTDATWNPITGCSVVSPGCTNCYAMKLAGTRLKHTPSRKGLTIDTKAGPVWNGAVRLNEQWIDQPLRWRRPRRIFVCAHGDLFAENVPDAWIDKVFAVMARAPHHTFQVLTKRAGRMREYVEQMTRQEWWKARLYEDGRRPARYPDWPLPNVWLGVSAEDQARADERIPELLQTPAAVRFISAEPLLGPIDLETIRWMDGDAEIRANTLTAEAWVENSQSASAYSNECDGVTKLDWIIVGGESGPKARPMHPDWARTLRDTCAAAGVAFFFKQWGAWLPTPSVDVYCHGPDRKRLYPGSAGIAWLADGRVCLRDFSVQEHAKRMRDGLANDTRAIECDRDALKDFHWSLIDQERAVDNPHGFQWMYCVGKTRAGRKLDGIEHSVFPAPHGEPVEPPEVPHV